MVEAEQLDFDQVINVSQVKHRSPFRYPGGKTWLVPYVRLWVASLEGTPTRFIEPFAGGAIVGLTVAAEELADHIVLVELDDDVASVWKTIIEGDGKWLANEIVDFQLSRESVTEVLERTAGTTKQRAFRTIVRNRVSRGGILASNAGLIKSGENGKGLGSRWYPETLKDRIDDIVEIRNRITFIHGDGIEAIEQNIEKQNVAFFVDPPYTAAGKKSGSRLYTHSQLDHKKLFDLVEKIKGDFLMTYNNAQEIQNLAEEHGLETHPIAMRNTHNAELTELLIGRDFRWIQ